MEHNPPSFEELVGQLLGQRRFAYSRITYDVDDLALLLEKRLDALDLCLPPHRRSVQSWERRHPDQYPRAALLVHRRPMSLAFRFCRSQKVNSFRSLKAQVIGK
jgi:hypothetical protein